MSEEYTLVRDIIYDHNERMHNIKKYYPFFRLADTTFAQYQDERYKNLDMGYILMGVLRFFIEENNFKERLVSYRELADFMIGMLRRDFDLTKESAEEMEELAAYIFDKLTNEGKPFTYEFFDPREKVRKSVRVKMIDSRVMENNVVYYITSDAIEFYLDTKEIKDESNITVAQVLLEKMIANKNFRGGTEVVSRINNEVAKLIARKNEILTILSYDIYEGMKAYESFMETGGKWFEEEEKLFRKNKHLIEQALRAGANDNRYFEAMDDIYHLETEINRAMNRHGELLHACMELQSRMDEAIRGAKIHRLKRSFDFRNALNRLMENGNVEALEKFVTPMMKPFIQKRFSLLLIDNLLSYKQDNDEHGEKIAKKEYNEDFKYEDELEEERIVSNYELFFRVLVRLLRQQARVEIEEYHRALVDICGENVLNNGDYYSFLVHLCQKKEYDLSRTFEKPDTFLEEMIKELTFASNLRFIIHFPKDSEEELVNIDGRFISNLTFERIPETDSDRITSSI